MNPLADGQWHRMHPATPLLRGGAFFVAIVAIVFANLRERLVDWIAHVPDRAREGDPIDAIVEHGWVLWALLGVLVVVALIIVWYRVTWQMTEFRVTTDAVELRSGVLNRQNRQARLDRIQGVNVHRTLFARVFGAARLEIVVAGHDANLSLQYLGSAAAEELRREILGLAGSKRASAAGLHSASPVAGAGFETGAVPEEHGEAARLEGPQAPRPPQPLEAPVAASFAPGPQLDAILRARADELIFSPADLHPDFAPASVVKVHPGRLIGSLILSPFTIVLIAIVVWLVVEVARGNYILLVAVIPSVFGMFTGYSRRFGRLARYTISGSSDGVRVGYGLLSTSSETIPTGRIHAVEVVQPLLWRPFGWWAIRIARAGRARQRGQAENASTILPVGSLEDVGRVLPLLLPASDHTDLLALVHATARFRREARLFSQAPRAAAWLHPFSWRRVGYAYVGDTLALRAGLVYRTLDFVPLARVQSVAIKQGPVRRMLGLVDLAVHVVDVRIRPRLSVIGAPAGAELFEQLARSAVMLASRDSRS
ncbi:PH domain-containing protein [Gryllotalpicola daejeonensis]|uniref:PH domain-containing protein n=1 Tax=Gryllotalpicola daejeonensis TaxID=993087 RepID=A0ABP7ZK13_9MICO